MEIKNDSIPKSAESLQQYPDNSAKFQYNQYRNRYQQHGRNYF